jgi:radical SAM superfamily enzyme YgiQ (UPF0313 family)
MIGKKSSMPPLGLLTLAGLLPPEEFSLKLVDLNVSPLSPADLAWADLVMVSAMITQKKSLLEVLEQLHSAGKKTVLGGPYLTTAYRETGPVDTYFIGEAESLWPEFLADLRQDKLRQAYAAPTTTAEAADIRQHFGPTAVIATAGEFPTLQNTPLPRFDLIDFDHYAVMPVQASRGCPVGCEFCDIWRRFGRRTRNKPIPYLRRELDELYRLGWRDSVFLVDDNFIGNRERALGLLTDLSAWQREHSYPFTFLTEATLTLADNPEILDQMVAAGFDSVFVGIETPCAESLRETKKHVNTRGSIADKVALIQSRGIQIMSGFIIGFDADPEDIARRMSDCIQEMGIPLAMLGILNALPDTDLYDRLAKEGRLRGDTSGNNTHHFALNFQPARPAERVVEDYKQILHNAYSPDMKSYFERASVLRRRWPQRRTAAATRSGLSLGWKAWVFGRYLLTTLRSSYRWQALRFLLATLFYKPSFFEEAITLGVKGHHLWAITRQAFELEGMRHYLHACLAEFSAFIQAERRRLGEIFIKEIPEGARSGGDWLAVWLSHLTPVTLAEASEEVRFLYQRALVVLSEIEATRQRIQAEAETRYRHLSRVSRQAFITEWEFFLAEANRLTPALPSPS